MAAARKLRKRAKNPRTRARRKEVGNLPVNCRCQCSTVCIIRGPAAIKAGSRKSYTLKISLAKNSGCVQSTSGCKQGTTQWTVAGQRAAAVTLSDKKKRSVKAKVAAGTAAGSFTLKAQPSYTCKCIGAAAGAAPVGCTDTPNVATIRTT